MAWIKTISPAQASGRLKEIYSRITDPSRKPDNIILGHSLRPHTLEGHLSLYKSVLHHHDNTLPRWFLETIGVYVSMLNHCDYCVDHHFAGLHRLLNDTHKSESIFSSLKNDRPENYFSGKELLLLAYARKVAMNPSSIQKKDVEHMQNSGIDDGEILEVNQVSAYFCFANRTVLGLGIDTIGDELGFHPQ